MLREKKLFISTDLKSLKSEFTLLKHHTQYSHCVYVVLSVGGCWNPRIGRYPRSQGLVRTCSVCSYSCNFIVIMYIFCVFLLFWNALSFFIFPLQRNIVFPITFFPTLPFLMPYFLHTFVWICCMNCICNLCYLHSRYSCVSFKTISEPRHRFYEMKLWRNTIWIGILACSLYSLWKFLKSRYFRICLGRSQT